MHVARSLQQGLLQHFARVIQTGIPVPAACALNGLACGVQKLKAGAGLPLGGEVRGRIAQWDSPRRTLRGSGRARRGPPAWHRVADPGHGRIDQCSRAGQHQGKQGPETRISPALEQILLDPLQAPHPNTCRHQQPEQNPLEIPAMRIPRRGRPRSWHGRQFRRRFLQGNRRGRGGVFLRHGKFPLNVRRPDRTTAKSKTDVCRMSRRRFTVRVEESGGGQSNAKSPSRAREGNVGAFPR